MYKIQSLIALSLCFSLEVSSSSCDEPLSDQPWSYFGPLHESYVAGRREKPEEVFNILKSYISVNAKILDVGSGTGISARQLHKNGFKQVIGIDRDSLMIKEARAANNAACSIKYFQADVTKGLPFPDEEFDVVTAFSSFHWFANSSSIREVSRILKPGGYYFIAGTSYKKDQQHVHQLKHQIKAIIEEMMGIKIPTKEIHATTDLEAQGFKIIVDKNISFTNYYTKEQYFTHIKSLSYWNIVKDSPCYGRVLTRLDQYLDSVSDEQGKIKDQGSIGVILAQKLREKLID